jgi:hypothetical protein
VPFSSVPRCSRPKASRLDGVDPSPTSLHHRQHMRRKSRSTRNNRKWGTSPHLSTPTLATSMMRATSSPRARGTRRMERATVTTLNRAAAMTVGRTRAHRPNPRTVGLQPRHLQHAVPDTVPATYQRHQVLQGNKPQALV